MSTTRRRRREYGERESRILEVARPMLVQEGYHGLSMDRIATQLEYAKGTIYNHFSCKEEIIIALAINALQRRAEMFRRATQFSGRPRERLVGVGLAGELFFRLCPDHFKVQQAVGSVSILEKTSQERKQALRKCEDGCVNVVGGIVRDAVTRGDLVLPRRMLPEDLVFGLCSLSFGAYAMISAREVMSDVGVRDPLAAAGYSVDALLDGLAWVPLSSEHDYAAVRRRIEREVFSDEVRRAMVA